MERHRDYFPVSGGAPVPWALLAACEHQVKANHGQTLEELARRGGLDPAEALAVLQGRRWVSMPSDVARRELDALVQRAAARAVVELEEARRALGKAWLAGGISLAEGIARKCAALERLGGTP